MHVSRLNARTPATPSRPPASSASRSVRRSDSPSSLAGGRPARGGSRRTRRARRGRSPCVEPVGEALVEFGPKPLRRRAIDRVLNDDVAEAERVLARGTHEAAPDERPEMGADSRRGIGLEERCHVVGRESSHTIEPRSSTARSPGPSRSRRAASSAWTVSGRACSARPPSSAEGEELLDEERVSLGRLAMRALWSDLQRRRPRAPREVRRVASAESALSRTRSTFSRASRNARLVFQQLVPCEADTRIRPSPWSASIPTSSRKVGSAQWTSSKTSTSGSSRARASQNCLKSHAISAADGGASASSAARTASPSLLRTACPRTSRSGQYVMPSPYERQRPVRGGHALRPARELRSEPGLADARRPDDDRDLHCLAFDRSLQALAERGELATTPDERRVEATLERWRPVSHLEQPDTPARAPACP